MFPSTDQPISHGLLVAGYMSTKFPVAKFFATLAPVAGLLTDQLPPFYET